MYKYYENFNKRVIKSPKLYFYEVGLASYLLGIENPDQIFRDPLKGGLFENMVINDLIKSRYNKGLDHQLYFYRDNNSNEVDVVMKRAEKLIPIEIKSSQTFNKDFVKGIRFFNSIIPEAKKHNGYVIYSGEQEQELNGTKIINFKNLDTIYAGSTG